MRVWINARLDPRPETAKRRSLELALARLSLPDFCQTFEVHLLLRAASIVLTRTQSALICSFMAKLEEEDRLPKYYESHALIDLDHT